MKWEIKPSGLMLITALFSWGWGDVRDGASQSTPIKSSAQIKPGQVTRTIRVDRMDRRAEIYVPPGILSDRPVPLIVTYHGGGGNPKSMMKLSGLNAKADQAGFIVAYPYGTGPLRNRLLSFNGGNCCGSALRNQVDDIKFTRLLLDELASTLPIDPQRIYATGISNGAIMAYRVASELSDRFAAIAPVAGPMGTAVCNPSQPVSVIHIHGTADRHAPFGGGLGVGFHGFGGTNNFYSVQHSLQNWIQANGCQTTPTVTQMPDLDPSDGTTVRMLRYSGGRRQTEVCLVEISNGGHTWPGMPSPMKSFGVSSADISATDLMVDFFQKHRKSPSTPNAQSGKQPQPTTQPNLNTGVPRP
jgi:polyhydroxybutyrate depolymerase